MLNLRNLVKHIPSLKRALTGSQSQLLQIVHEVSVIVTGRYTINTSQMISDERLPSIEQLVCENLNEETIVAKVLPSFCLEEKSLTPQ